MCSINCASVMVLLRQTSIFYILIDVFLSYLLSILYVFSERKEPFPPNIPPRFSVLLFVSPILTSRPFTSIFNFSLDYYLVLELEMWAELLGVLKVFWEMVRVILLDLRGYCRALEVKGEQLLLFIYIFNS